MRPPRSVWIILVIAILALPALWWKMSHTHGARELSASPLPTVPPPGKRDVSAEDPLVHAFEGLEKSADPLATLQDLREKLAMMTPAESVAWIREFLKSGKDKATGLSFEIGRDHMMKQCPTFRTFLLDALHAIDPAAAADISREVLSKPTTADEWALALRNVGLADSSPESNTTLREKTEALINNPSWQTNPSIGYLNAFDVLVHTKAVQSTPLLSSLIQRKDRKDLVHAAFLTLDRLVQRDPEEMLAQLAGDRALQQSRPEMAAQQFARADLRDPDQQAIVKAWLLDPARTGTELNSFSGIYPNNNRFVSDNLLTNESPQSGADLAAHDRAALEILNAWSADPVFFPVKPHITAMIARLKGFAANSDNQPP